MNRHNQKGFSLLEMALGLALSTSVVAAVFAFYAPAVAAYTDVMSSRQLAAQQIVPLDLIEKEAANMRALYVDPAQCWESCMVDGSGNRIYYYWSNNSLYRKKEAITNAISCTGGQVIATGLDSAASSFSLTKSLLTVTMAGRDNRNNLHQVTSTIFPSIQERDIIFYEGFECNTLQNGWIITNGGQSTWSILGSASQGHYQVGDTFGGGAQSTSTIEIGIDLSRVAKAHLQFSYMNDGSIAVPDTFTVSLYDGTQWHTVFNDTSGQLIATSTQVTADLTGYSLNTDNKLRFSGTLHNAGSHWYVDAISIFNP